MCTAVKHCLSSWYSKKQQVRDFSSCLNSFHANALQLPAAELKRTISTFVDTQTASLLQHLSPSMCDCTLVLLSARCDDSLSDDVIEKGK